jgi:hypothetical protein
MSKFRIGRDYSQKGNVYQAGIGLIDNFKCLEEFVQDIFHEIHNPKDHKILTELLLKKLTDISERDLGRCQFENTEEYSELKRVVRGY